MEKIVTDIFKVNGKALSRNMIALYGGKWIAGAAVLLLPMILLGIFHDLRWIIVALMAIFIVAPMVLAFLFFYYGMNRISVINSTHHRLEFGDNAITAYLYNKTPSSADADEPEYELRSHTDVDYSSVADYIVGSSDVILRTSSKGKGFLLIPLASFSSDGQFSQAIQAVTKGMREADV